jgi:hypothetical protein
MVRDARELRGAWTTFQTLWYGAPPADLSHVVSGYWAAEWDLRGQPRTVRKSSRTRACT